MYLKGENSLVQTKTKSGRRKARPRRRNVGYPWSKSLAKADEKAIDVRWPFYLAVTAENLQRM